MISDFLKPKHKNKMVKENKKELNDKIIKAEQYF